MPIVVKGDFIINNAVEQKEAPQPETFKWDSASKKLVKTEQQTTEPEKRPTPKAMFTQVHKHVVHKETTEQPSHYVVEDHGELQKLFNTKSDYLKDVLDLQSDK